MRKSAFSIIAIILFFVTSQKPVHSFGLGAFIEGGGGGTFYLMPGFDDRNSGQFFIGGGFIFDTAVSTNTLFNYRACFAYNWTRATAYTPPEYYLVSKIIPPDNQDLNQIKLINSFGFGLIRNETMRLWLGPQLNFFYTWGDTTILGRYGTWNINRKDTMSIGGVGFGFVLGVNFNFTGLVSLATEAGLRLNIAGGSTYGTYTYNASSGKDATSVVNIKPEVFATVGVLFRIYDRFAR
jgi:hypothetical protein